MHCKGFLETWLTFEVPTPLIPLLFSVVLCVCLLVVQGKIRLWEVRGKSITQVSLCYILKHLEDRKAWPVLIYYTWCDIILIFKLHRRTRLTPRSSIHSLKIRMTSHPCNKYEQIMLSYLLSVKFISIMFFSKTIDPEQFELLLRLQIFEKLWSFVIQVTKVSKQTLRGQ